LQMLLTLLSSLLFSESICLSMSSVRVLVGRPLPGIVVPFSRNDPEDCAVPTVLVPGAFGSTSSLPRVDSEGVVRVEDGLAMPLVAVASGDFAELPAPLGSLPELFRPAALAGPLGTPFTPMVPAPVEPAWGEPGALPLRDGPLAAPADALPALPPLLLPPPPPPCAKAIELVAKKRTAIIQNCLCIAVLHNLENKPAFRFSFLCSVYEVSFPG
jgi:hypothetical protein